MYILKNGSRKFANSASITVFLMTFFGCAAFEGAPPRPDGSASLEVSDKLYYDALKKYHETSDLDNKTNIRNEFIENRAALIDQNYSVFVQEIYSRQIASNVGVDLATLGLNVVGASVASVDAKTALHAISGGIIGGKASIDKNVYFDRTLPALLAQMNGLRTKIRIRLLNGALVSPVRYSLMQAEADLKEYYHSGTIYGAVAGITTQAVIDQRIASEKIDGRLPTEDEVNERLRLEGFIVKKVKASKSGDLFIECFKPGGGKINAENEKLVKGWLAKNGIKVPGATPVSDFSLLPEYEKNREIAIVDLKGKLKNCPLSQ